LSFFQPQHGGNLAWAAAQADCLPQEILDFSASINPLGPPPSVLAAIQDRLGEISAYPDPASKTIRSALAQLHHIPSDWIMVGNGAAELLTWACRSLSTLDQVHLLTPAFSDYRRALKAFDAKICPHAVDLSVAQTLEEHLSPQPFQSFQSPQLLLSQSLAQLPKSLGTSDSGFSNAGLLLNNPHNPTGQVVVKAELLPLVDRFSQVTIDEAFVDFLPDPDAYSLVDEVVNHRNLAIVRSLTKFYSIPGLRLGYAIAHPDLLAQWQSWRDPWSVNALALAAGVAAIQDEAFQFETHRWLTAAKPQLYEGLAAIPGLFPLPSAANFLLVRCNVSATALQQVLLKQRILIRDCLSFPELGDRYFRVAVRTEVENARFLQALSAALSKLEPAC
jgi:L-threonine-O-3-phosphate decarboxylase